LVYSDSSNLTGLVEDIDFICGTDSTSYPLKDKARNINRHYYVAVSDILKSSGRFQFDDSNLTTVNAPTFTLVNGQSQYSLPTDFLKLTEVEILDNGGNWVKLQEIDPADISTAISDFEDTPGVPKYYDVQGNMLTMYPAPATGSVTLTNGGKLHYQREVDHFVSTDTTQEPGFAEPYHRILSLGASYDWLVINSSQDKADRIFAQYMAMRAELKKFYSDQNRDSQIRFRPAHRTADYL
jgi:hypothetical protein